MKKEITDRIRLLGGNVANLKGNSLKEDLCAITFDTALFLKPVDTPWLAAEDTEPIEGLGDWVDEHMELFNSDREAFYKEMTDTFFTLDEEPRPNCYGLPDHLRHSKKGHRILKNGMVGLRIMQSWVKSSSIQIVPLRIL